MFWQKTYNIGRIVYQSNPICCCLYQREVNEDCLTDSQEVRDSTPISSTIILLQNPDFVLA